MRRLTRAWIPAPLAGLLIIFCLLQPKSQALPTMIRLGYTNCSSCHIAPQGGGLLNLYGRSIDQAQSLVGGEYEPWQSAFAQTINWGGRITQDFRLVMQQQDTSTTDKAGTQLFRNRFIYRNATELGHGWRITATVTGENASAPRPTLSYDLPAKPLEVFVNTALISYRTGHNLEFSAGRDMLPTGVDIADLSVFVRARNRLGYYDSPTQAKVFWWGKRYLINPYAFGPGGNERSGLHESGGGMLAEMDVLGNHRTVAGMNFLQGESAGQNRRMIGPYTRLGFGRWGFLAEHDITDRTLKTGTLTTFRQTASYGQLFWAAREWLVASLIGERLRVEAPYTEHLNAAKFELAARLTSQATVSIGPRIQWDPISGRITRSVVFQLAVKTVH
ncbi:MAG TPA: hypothetical protein VKU19_05355 [Bryobacteraceae bacterium]|nr:hypothetical protein [Bryobacteraceae bacterium]